MRSRVETMSAELALAEAEATLTIEPIPGAFGAMVRNVDLAGPLSQADFLAIGRALRDHHVLVIEGQALEKAQYLAFGQRWGVPIVFFHASHREQEFPQLITIHNRPDTPEEQ